MSEDTCNHVAAWSPHPCAKCGRHVVLELLPDGSAEWRLTGRPVTTGYKHLHQLNGVDAAVFKWLTSIYGHGCLLWIVR